MRDVVFSAIPEIAPVDRRVGAERVSTRVEVAGDRGQSATEYKTPIDEVRGEQWMRRFAVDVVTVNG
jgi:hypothetical protein